ncbi:hypothetical protein OCU04_001082 [Sclerotinia nivalis]|uniref:Uncharacterized protein n=1 Tax=Sclerotinia nivalis TaxID=352851 RepID=A0A9X0DP18_9HELO|nr:hypothetical protein OCU04_001082 [Sclerotinia nivalis]
MPTSNQSATVVVYILAAAELIYNFKRLTLFFFFINFISELFSLPDSEFHRVLTFLTRFLLTTNCVFNLYNTSTSRYLQFPKILAILLLFTIQMEETLRAIMNEQVLGRIQNLMNFVVNQTEQLRELCRMVVPLLPTILTIMGLIFLDHIFETLCQTAIDIFEILFKGVNIGTLFQAVNIGTALQGVNDILGTLFQGAHNMLQILFSYLFSDMTLSILIITFLAIVCLFGPIASNAIAGKSNTRFMVLVVALVLLILGTLCITLRYDNHRNPAVNFQQLQVINAATLQRQITA